MHPTAVVSKSAVFDPTQVSIGPHAVIDDGVTLADGAAVGAGMSRRAGMSALGRELSSALTGHGR